jgi:GxxExxY protein
MVDLLFKEEVYRIVGICMHIHKTLGMGLKEINYKDAIQIDLLEQYIPFEREKQFNVKYKGQTLRHPYFADFLVFDSIIVEVKAASCIVDSHIAQTISYLGVSGMKVGLLVNFGERSLTWKRVILN